ncbi:MAG: glycosyltransferase [Spirochaetaceae bacterium]|jgi:lipopolysaccharide biosynthesis glycosyltransferase|nr:glycosyltransferase [Spirochaetaceae bacterium]
MLKYLYVLVSDTTDYYLENALLSMYSLKMHIPQAHISLLCDDGTHTTLTGVRKNILNFVDEVKVLQIEAVATGSIENSFNKMQRSRWLKTSMRRHIAGDFLFIDSDTIIADSMEELTGLNIDIGAVLDCHIVRRMLTYTKEFHQIHKKLGFDSNIKKTKYFNSGIIFCRDTSVSHSFFDKWHELWLYTNAAGYSIDQPAFSRADSLLNEIVVELDGIWNCQILTLPVMPFLNEAKIIHYFVSCSVSYDKPRDFSLADISLFEAIKETGMIPEETKKLLRNPLKAFTKGTIFYCRSKSGFLLSPTFRLLNGLYKKNIIKWFDIPAKQIITIYSRLLNLLRCPRKKRRHPV